MRAPTVHTIIFSWPRYCEETRAIAEACREASDHLSVLHSGPLAFAQPDESWKLLPDDHYFGWKMREAIASNRADIMLVIHADTSFYDWGVMIERMRSLYETMPDLGIWAPDFDYTGYPFASVELERLPKLGLSHVSQTDGIVMAYSRAVCDQLKEFSLDENRLGWGVEWAAVAVAHELGLHVVRDWHIRLMHPKSTSYSSDAALLQMRQYLDSLPAKYQERISTLMRERKERNKKAKQGGFKNWLRKRVRKFKKRYILRTNF